MHVLSRRSVSRRELSRRKLSQKRVRVGAEGSSKCVSEVDGVDLRKRSNQMVVHQQRREVTFSEVAGLNELIHSRDQNPKLFPSAPRCALVMALVSGGQRALNRFQEMNGPGSPTLDAMLEPGDGWRPGKREEDGLGVGRKPRGRGKGTTIGV